MNFEIDDKEARAIYDALVERLGGQKKALKDVNAALPNMSRPYMPSDFGIPVIENLLRRLDEMDWA